MEPKPNLLPREPELALRKGKKRINPIKQIEITEAEPLTGRKRMRPITFLQAMDLLNWEIEYRFVREVERLERAGVVPSRPELEASLGYTMGEIRAIRAGARGVSPAHIALLHDRYRGDRDYILHGRRNEELSRPYIPGIGNIAKYEGYVHVYNSPARWRVGPRPEIVFPIDPSNPNSEKGAWHYPEDPKNEQWRPGRLRNITDIRREQAEREGKAQPVEQPAEE